MNLLTWSNPFLLNWRQVVDTVILAHAVSFLYVPILASFLFIFVLFSSTFKFEFKKAYMLYLSIKSGAAGRKAQMDPLSYGGHQTYREFFGHDAHCWIRV